MKKLIKEFTIIRDFNIYPDSDFGRHAFACMVQSEAEREQIRLEQELCIVCDFTDFPIISQNVITEWIIQITELPEKQSVEFGDLLFYTDSLMLDNFGTIVDIGTEEAIYLLEENIIRTKARIEQLKKIK